jgi:DNA topoisomerase-3
LEKKTKPPVLYTEAGLLSAMETAGKEIENEEERKALKISVSVLLQQEPPLSKPCLPVIISNGKEILNPYGKRIAGVRIGQRPQNCGCGNDRRMGIGFAENRKQRSGCRVFQKKWKPMPNPLPMNCCKPPLPKQPA